MASGSTMLRRMMRRNWSLSTAVKAGIFSVFRPVSLLGSAISTEVPPPQDTLSTSMPPKRQRDATQRLETFD
jgi:hypothetical protein